MSSVIGRPKLHGESHPETPEYRAWVNMRARCTSPTHQHFSSYGGRGIRVCARWMKYVQFLTDMGRRPSPDHTLERVNNNKGYTPRNCKWAHYTEQQRNRRSTKLTCAKACKIRAAVATGVPQKDLAIQYGVSRAEICMVVAGKVWV